MFLQFLSNFNETLSISLFFRGRLVKKHYSITILGTFLNPVWKKIPECLVLLQVQTFCEFNENHLLVWHKINLDQHICFQYFSLFVRILLKYSRFYPRTLIFCHSNCDQQLFIRTILFRTYMDFFRS